LEGYLNSRYPKLKYLIVVFLICKDCFHNKKEGVDSILKDSKSTHIKIHYIKKDIIFSHMNTIKKAYLRTNPTMFKDILYCYTDKIKDKQIITLNMCDGNITNKTKSKAKAKAKTKTKSKKNKIAYRKNKKTLLNKK